MTINQDMLVTDWGEWPVPADLKALWEKAPKVEVTGYVDEIFSSVPDHTTVDGSKFYARERELIEAIKLISESGTMKVVAA